MSTDKSVLESLLKDEKFSEMSLLYIDQEAIEDLKEIGQGNHEILYLIWIVSSYNMMSLSIDYLL